MHRCAVALFVEKHYRAVKHHCHAVVEVDYAVDMSQRKAVERRTLRNTAYDQAVALDAYSVLERQLLEEQSYVEILR